MTYLAGCSMDSILKERMFFILIEENSIAHFKGSSQIYFSNNIFSANKYLSHNSGYKIQKVSDN